MKTNRKILAVLTALTLSASLSACGGSEPAASTSGTSSTAAAPAAGTVYKVGIVQYVDDASLNQIVQNIESELDKKGEELGVTFDYADYYQNGQADSTVINQIAADLIADDVDIIVPIATPTAMIMQTATEDNQIPVVFSAVTDPVAAGLVASMDAPGANITGTSDALDTAAVMNLILAANPDCKKVGLLYDMGQDSSTAAIADAKAFLDEKGIAYVEKNGTTSDEVLLAAEALVAEGVDAVFTPTDNTIMTAELSIYETLANAGIPHFCGADSFALNGAFCGYGVDYANLGTMTGDMVADILVNGADPASTPVLTFDNGIATVNTETAASIGYNMDDIKTAFEPLCTQLVEITTSESFQ